MRIAMSGQLRRPPGEHTGAFVALTVTTRSGGMKGPLGLVFGPDGTLYVSSDMD